MSILELHTLIGEGKSRNCYVHPEDVTKCVKVVHADKLKFMESRGWNVNHREYDLWQNHIRDAANWRHFFPTLHGLEMTNLGEGLVCDIIRDDSGEISGDMREFRKTATPEQLDILRRQVLQIYREIVRRRLLVVDWWSHNFLVQKTGDAMTLKLIDFQTRPNTARVFKRLKAARKARKLLPLI